MSSGFVKNRKNITAAVIEIEYTKAVENASEKYQHFVSSVSIFSAHETLHECPKSITRIT